MERNNDDGDAESRMGKPFEPQLGPDGHVHSVLNDGSDRDWGFNPFKDAEGDTDQVLSTQEEVQVVFPLLGKVATDKKD